MWYAPGDSLQALRVLGFLEGQSPLPALPDTLPRGVEAWLAPDEAAFAELTGGLAPEWSAGVALPGLRRLVVPSYASARTPSGARDFSTLRHEWAHLGLHQYLGGLRIPRWFDEGYAQWASTWDRAEAWRLRVLLALGRTPPLDSLSLGWPGDRASAEAAYLLAASAVEYLVRESGERGLRLFLERWREVGSFDPALRSTYGVTAGQFEEDWRRWVEETYGWLFVLSHSMVFWAVLALALILMVRVRRRWNREKMAKLRAEEPAEDPAWWEESWEGGEG